MALDVMRGVGRHPAGSVASSKTSALETGKCHDQSKAQQDHLRGSLQT